MKCRFLLLLAIAVLATLVVASNPDQPQLIISEKNGYLVLPPEVIGKGTLTDAAWSPSGSQVLLTLDLVDPKKWLSADARQRPMAEKSLLLYSLDTGKSVVLWRGLEGTGKVEQMSWFPGTETALVMIREVQRTVDPAQQLPSLMRICTVDARQGTLREIKSITQVAGSPEIELDPSPQLPVASLQLTSLERGDDGFVKNVRREFRLLRSDGSDEALKLDDPDMFLWGWGDGGVLLVGQRVRETGSQRVSMKMWNLDLKSRAMVEVFQPRAPSDKLGVPDLSVTWTNVPVSSADAVGNLKCLWLIGRAKSDSRLLIAGDAGNAKLAPNLSGVVYAQAGVVVLRRLNAVSKEQAMKALSDDRHAAAMNASKQMATGMLMYAADWDDAMPPKDGSLSILNPYTKDPTLSVGFVYTYAGGLLSGLKDPAHTEIGYTQGQGGRAVAFADGHVEWVPDKP